MSHSRLLDAAKRITAFAIPVSLTSLINVCTNFFAMLMVARISKHELAAGALSVSTYITLMTFVSTTMYAISIMISHHLGAKKPEQRIGYIIQHGFCVGMTLATPAAFLLWHADQFLLFIGQDPHLVKLTTAYFHFMACTLFTTAIIMLGNQFFNGIKRPNFNFKAAVVRLPMTLFLAYLFVLGKWGMPQMGLGGLGLAILCAQAAYSLFLLAYLFFSGTGKRYGIFHRPFNFSWACYKKILNMGMPIGIQFCAEIGAMTVGTYFLGHFGVAPLAAAQIVGQYAMLAVMINISLSQSVAVFVSQSHGEKDYVQMRYYIRATALVLCLVFSVILAIFILAPTQLVDLYLDTQQNTHSQIVHYAVYFFLIAGLYLFIDGFRNMMAGALRGLYDTRAPMQIGVASLWCLSLPAAYVTGFTLGGGPIALRAAFISGFIVATILLAKRLKLMIMKLEQQISQENAPSAS